jgi:hypothetical protein
LKIPFRKNPNETISDRIRRAVFRGKCRDGTERRAIGVAQCDCCNF